MQWSSWLVRPGDPARLQAFERVFTLTFAAYLAVRFLHVREWLTADGFHYSQADYPPFEGHPLPLLPLWGAVLFGGVFYAAVFAVVCGCWRRGGLLVLFLGSVYVNFADTSAAAALNRVYIVIYALLATAPSARMTGDGLIQSRAPVLIIQTYVIVFYVGAGLAKAWHGEWAGNSDAVWHIIQGVYRTDFGAWCLNVLPMWTFGFMHWSALVFEIGAPLWLGIAKLRPAGVVVGVSLHAFIAFMFTTVIWFSLQMIAFYILFLPNKWWVLLNKGVSKVSLRGIDEKC